MTLIGLEFSVAVEHERYGDRRDLTPLLPILLKHLIASSSPISILRIESAKYFGRSAARAVREATPEVKLEWDGLEWWGYNNTEGNNADNEEDDGEGQLAISNGV
ncbi:hypothetical protein NMY22_g1010 [Coprinellus aureogranulatus]|nr:hypothetical protein NMY22_g1010 [Coprinellus aureogranulatus]